MACERGRSIVRLAVMSERKIDVMAAVRSAYGFAPGAATGAWAPLGVGAIASLTLSLAPRHLAGGGLLGMLAVGVIVAAWTYGALYRIAFAGERADLQPRAGGLAWGGPENRALIAFLLLLLFMTLITVAALFTGLLAATVLYATVGAGRGMGSPREWMVAISGALIFIGVGFSQLRLALALPGSVAGGEVKVFTTWSLTKGQALRLLAAAVFVAAPTILGQALVSTLAAVHLAAGPLRSLIAVLEALIQPPLWVGFGAYAWRVLRKDPGEG